MTDGYRPAKSNSDTEAEIVQFEWDGDMQPSMAAVEAVAAAVGHSPTELNPLYESIDPEALDAIVTPEEPESKESVHVSFTYEGVDVLVDSQNGIEIRLDDAGDDSPADSRSG